MISIIIIIIYIYIYIYIISNYMNHHKKKNLSCGITEHFVEDGHSFEEDFRILPIVRLVNPPVTMAKRRKRLEEFELYW